MREKTCAMSRHCATMLYLRARERARSSRTTLASTNTNPRDKLKSGMRYVGISRQNFVRKYLRNEGRAAVTCILYREKVFRMMTLATYFKVIEIGEEQLLNNYQSFWRITRKLKPSGGNMYGKKLFRMTTFTTYFKVIQIGEVYPLLYNYRNLFSDICKML